IEDDGDVVLPMVVAPPEAAHTLVVDLPPARKDAALCTGVDGETFWLGGTEGETPVATGFVVEPLTRAVRPAPALPSPRTGGSCFLDGTRLFVVGGCDAEAQPSPMLWRLREEGEEGPWTLDDDAPLSGCYGAETRLADGRFVVVNEVTVSLYDPLTGERTTTPLRRARRSPVLVTFTREAQLWVLMGGGYEPGGEPASLPGAELFRIDDRTLVYVGVFEMELTAAVTGRDAAFVLDGGALRPIAPDRVGGSIFSPQSVVTGASSLVWTTNEQLAALSHDGQALHIWGASGLRTIEVVPPRPLGRLVTLPGGTLLVFGGGHAGIAVFVVDDQGSVVERP
ncbi:MAG: hypothetical protein ACO3JL_17760, partial [Myxococcota bacterium]